MAEIVMPRLSDTMEEGTILRWLKRSGEHVGRGEELVEIETDKAAMIYESDEDGVLEIAVGEGETLPVGATIAHVGAATGSDKQAAAGPTAPTQAAPQPGMAAPQPSTTTPQPNTATPQPTVAAPQPGTAEPRPGTGMPRPSTATPQPDRAAPQPSTATPQQSAATPRPGTATLQPDTANPPARVKASPVARRVARERKVNLNTVTGSGPGGRIVKADVEAAAVGGAPGDGPATSDGGVPASEPQPPLVERVATAKGETTSVELTRTQQTIARRMAESKATIPDFSLEMEIDMEKCVALRGELKRLSPEQAPTYNDMIVKACALALREHPRANGSYRDGRLQLHSRVNVGIAVATDDALVVPTVFDADLKSLGEIARETRTLAERVRAGTITPPELGGGTFTVSNLGMYGVRSFTAIVNPPQTAILSVGSMQPRPWVSDGEIVVRQSMAVVLACDHRVLYGADAARMLARIRALLEEPAALTL